MDAQIPTMIVAQTGGGYVISYSASIKAVDLTL